MPDGDIAPSGICCWRVREMKLKELLCAFRRLWRDGAAAVFRFREVLVEWERWAIRFVIAYVIRR